MRYCECLGVSDGVSLKKDLSYEGLNGMQSWRIKDGSVKKGGAGELVVLFGLEVIGG